MKVKLCENLLPFMNTIIKFYFRSKELHSTVGSQFLESAQTFTKRNIFLSNLPKVMLCQYFWPYMTCTRTVNYCKAFTCRVDSKDVFNSKLLCRQRARQSSKTGGSKKNRNLKMLFIFPFLVTRSLIEIDFNHPYLTKQIPAAFFNCVSYIILLDGLYNNHRDFQLKKELALQVHKVEPMQLGEFVAKKLQCELSHVNSLTVFERDPHIEVKYVLELQKNYY